MEQENLMKDYASRLRMIRDMSQEDLGKIKKMFSPLRSESCQTIIKYLAKQRLKGDNTVWRQKLLTEMVEVYKFDQTRIGQNLRVMINAGILKKVKDGDKHKMYGLSDAFVRISKAIVLIKPDLVNVVLKKNE